MTGKDKMVDEDIDPIEQLKLIHQWFSNLPNSVKSDVVRELQRRCDLGEQIQWGEIE